MASSAAGVGIAGGDVAAKAKDSKASAEEKVRARLERLVNRLLTGSVVPFVGAGVSQQSLAPEGEYSEKGPAVWHLNELLGKKLRDQFGAATDGYRAVCKGALKVQLDDPAVDVSKLKLNDLAELTSWLLGPVEVCETLHIHELDQVEFAQAHLYMALLAREGMIQQVVTTNYDTCLERAFRSTFSDLAYSDVEWEFALSLADHDDGIEPSDPPMGVITDLWTYRRHAARRQTETGRPVFQLYKINGCAKRYAQFRNNPNETKDRKRKEAARIILTERQLQSFRGENWARDLTRMLATTRTLVFTGFGSEEPQIRHTMLTLMSEFERDANGNGHNGSTASPDRISKLPIVCVRCESIDEALPSPRFGHRHIMEQPNAPFVSAFDPELSFNQLQVLRGYYSAHWDKCHCDRPFLNNNDLDWTENAFTGKDAAGFEADIETIAKRQLPADLFWKRCFQMTWGKLLARYAGPESDFYRWLKGVPGIRNQEGLIRDQMLEWYYPKSEVFGRFRELLEPYSSFNRSLRISLWLESARGSHRSTELRPDENSLARCWNPTIPTSKFPYRIPDSEKNADECPTLLCQMKRSVDCSGIIAFERCDHRVPSSCGHCSLPHSKRRLAAPYTPLFEDSILVLSMLLLTWLLNRDLSFNVEKLKRAKSNPVKQLGTRVMPTESVGLQVWSHDGVIISLVTDQWKEPPNPADEDTLAGRLVRQVVLPCRLLDTSSKRLITKLDDSGLLRRVRRIESICAEDAIKALWDATNTEGDENRANAGSGAIGKDNDNAKRAQSLVACVRKLFAQKPAKSARANLIRIEE